MVQNKYGTSVVSDTQTFYLSLLPCQSQHAVAFSMSAGILVSATTATCQPERRERGKGEIAVFPLGHYSGLRRSPGEGNGNPLQYSGLENPMDRGACATTVYGVTKSWTQLSDWAQLKSHTSLTLIFHWPGPTGTAKSSFKEQRRQWQSTPGLLPGKFYGQRSLVGCHLWGRTESDMPEVT